MTQAALKSPVEGGGAAKSQKLNVKCQKCGTPEAANLIPPPPATRVLALGRGRAFFFDWHSLREENSMTGFGKNSRNQQPAASELWEFSIFMAGQTPAFCRRAGRVPARRNPVMNFE